MYVTPLAYPKKIKNLYTLFPAAGRGGWYQRTNPLFSLGEFRGVGKRVQGAVRPETQKRHPFGGVVITWLLSSPV